MRVSMNGFPKRIGDSPRLLAIVYLAFIVSCVHGDSLDSVIGSIDSGKEGGTCILSASNQGEKTFTFNSDDNLKITALLSTYGEATLSVTLKRRSGETVSFMKWTRADGSDSSPLKIEGQDIPESMFERSHGDFSPREITRELKVAKGDSLSVFLGGDIGEGRAFLSITGQDIENSGSSSAGSSDDSGDCNGSSGGVNLSFSKDWEFEVEGTIEKTTGFARLFQGDGSIHSRKIDAFTAWGNGFRFRLANKKISFTSALVGNVHNPGGQSDHWLEAEVGSVKKGEQVTIKVQYSYGSRNLKIYWNGKLAADAFFTIHSMPSDVKSISLTGMSGTVH